MLRPGQILFTYLHLAPDPEQTKDLVASGAICIAYETVTADTGGLPLLAPMSEVAGRMAVQAGAHFLEKPNGGRGILLGGVPGVAPGKVVILGGGVVGTHAAMIALGHGRGRHRARPQPRRDARAVEAIRFGAQDRLLEPRGRRAPCHRRGSRHRWRADPRRIRAQTGVRRDDPEDAAGLRRGRRGDRPGGLFRNIARRRRTRNQRTSSTAWSTTAWPTCRAACRIRRRSHSTTPRCRSRWRWPTRDGSARSPRMGTCAMASMWRSARSPAHRSRMRLATNTCRQGPCCSDAGSRFVPVTSHRFRLRHRRRRHRRLRARQPPQRRRAARAFCCSKPGPSDRYLWIHIPIGYGKTMFHPVYNWGFYTEPEPGMNGRTIYWPRGRGLGGARRSTA